MQSRMTALAHDPLSAPVAAPSITPDVVTDGATTDDGSPDAFPNLLNDAVVSGVVRSSVHKRKTRGDRKRRRNREPAPCGECADCLWQAEICCEQARAAARLKRLHAACGLFATAQSLLTRAIASSGDACVEACEDAREKLKNIASEMATYADLARSTARPMRALGTSPLETSASPAGARTSRSQPRAHPDGLAS